jgi:hypothetical protein
MKPGVYLTTLLLVITLVPPLTSSDARADDAVVGWVESPDFSAFKVIRNGQDLPPVNADLQACDTVQLLKDQAVVRITLSGYQRIQLDASVNDKKVQVPCAEKPGWFGKSLALVRAIAGMATAPSAQTEALAGTRGQADAPPLMVMALGNYNPLLVAGERSLFITWSGGQGPYSVTLRHYNGAQVVGRNDIDAHAVRLPKVQLPPGRYVLLVQGSNKYGIKEDNVTIVAPSRLPAEPKTLRDASLSKSDHQLLYAYYLEGWGKGEWTLEALQRAAAIDPPTPAATDWIARRFAPEDKTP